MKIYKINLSTRIFATVFFLFLIGLWFFGLVDNEVYAILKIICYFLIPITAFGIHELYTTKIIIDDDKVGMSGVNIYNLFRDKKIKFGTLFLNWNEIEEIKAYFILYPESPIIILKPKDSTKKRRMEIVLGGIGGMDLGLLEDIIAHLPAGTPVSLYPYLEKLLQRKPDSRRKVIIITVILIFTILSGFLLAQFKLDDVAIILSIVVLIGIAITTSIWHK